MPKSQTANQWLRDESRTGSSQPVCGTWQLKSQSLTFERQPAIMGIVNVTPDSFSDGGKFCEASAAIDHALRLAAEGADVLDIGGESTRPYSQSISIDEELARVIPVIESVARQTSIPVSVDTSKAGVAQAAIAAGAEIINDVTGLCGDPHMVEVALESGAGICVMHMQGTPQTMQDNPDYDDVVSEIFDYLDRRKQALTSGGISAEKICLDPGIGFGKTHDHNLSLLRHVSEFHRLGCPVLVGHSRKGFIRKLTGDESAEQTAGTLAVSLYLASQRVQVLRVHDVLATRQALAMQTAIYEAE